MNFMNAYKKLEKLCSEAYGDHHGISAYIEQMQKNTAGGRYVPGWEEDLKQLKHYRWVRNRIAHDPDCTEENMCTPADARWLQRFYSRMLSENDPLTLYRKARSRKSGQGTRQTKKTHTAPQAAPRRWTGCLVTGAVVLAMAALALWLIRGI